MYKSLISLVKFIPKYFTHFDAVISGIVFSIPFLNCLLLVYRSTINFGILTLYPVNLLNSLISCNFLRIFYVYDHFICK